MKQSVLTIRLEEDLKNEFAALCKKFGMSTTTALTVYVRAVVRDRRIPFEIADDSIAPERPAPTKGNKKENAQIQELTAKLLGVIARGGKERGRKPPKRTK